MSYEDAAKVQVGLGDACISEFIDMFNCFSHLTSNLSCNFIDLTLLLNLIEQCFLCNLQLACFLGGYSEEDF
jgi:hypothetical protein